MESSLKQRMQRTSVAWALVLGALLALPPCAMATDTDSGAIAYGEQVLGPQKHATGVTALGPDLFGEEVNTYTGGISFAQTDLSLPGNDDLPVDVTRRLVIDGNKSPSFSGDVNLWRGHPFGEWELDLPYIGGTYSKQDGWVVHTASPDARCSSPTTWEQFQPSDVTNGLGVWFYSIKFWNGLQLNVPGAGEQNILYRPAGAPLPTPAGTWTALTTKNQWHFSCLSTLQSGQPGEGFLALAPDGKKYWFNWMVSFADRPEHAYGSVITEEGHVFHTQGDLDRREYRLYPTRIEDRFGNYVAYSYANTPTDGLKLTQISASDGRLITLAYDANGQIVSSTAGAQTVQYGYADGLLTSVTLPDSSGWAYSTSAVVNLSRYVSSLGSYDEPFTCQRMRTLTGEAADLAMTNPSGATGTFHLAYNRLYRTDLEGSIVRCGANENPDGAPISWRDEQPDRPLRFDVLALQTKTLSGSGVPAQTWQFQHQDAYALRPSAGDPINGTRTMTTVAPDGSKEVSVFGTDALINEGQLLSHQVQAADGTVLSRKDNTYVQTSEMGSVAFPDSMGQQLNYVIVPGRDDYNRPLKKSVLQQQGVSFTWAIPSSCYGTGTLCFDPQVRPIEVTKSNTLGYIRDEQTYYADNTTKWVLGLVTQLKCVAAMPANPACDGGADSVESAIAYDPTYAIPTSTSVFGKLQKTSTYDLASAVTTGQRGTLKTIKDGNNNVTTLTGWTRGIPESIVFADGKGISAAVDANGWIMSVTDENGYATGYRYDAVGRLRAILYPANDSTVWNGASISYQQAPATTTEYGIPGGHWKRTEGVGTARKVTYFDAMWRPLVEEQYDNTDVANTHSFVVKRYDIMGRQAFQSYPVPSLNAGYSDTTLTGTRTSYDALGRVTQVDQDSEIGPLSTKTVYLTTFKSQLTNPRGYRTVTSYMAFDQPSTDLPVRVQSSFAFPTEVDTDIGRDVFGKPTSITRHDPDNALRETRSYAYNNNQLLCRSTDPETGATLMGYDGAGNLAWSAAGLPTSTTCDAEGDTAAILPRRVTRSYDARNRLASLTFPDGLGDQSWTYNRDGRPHVITTYNGTAHTLPVLNIYHYNMRGLLDQESNTAGGGAPLYISYGYDSNGHLSSQKWPDGTTVQFQPDALGRPTAVDTGTGNAVASGAHYFPDGALQSFFYGNGILHTLTQNDRHLPETSTDRYGTNNIISDSYDYDANGNVVAITDGATGRAQRGNRDMVYDRLDRLFSAASPMFGNGAAGTATFRYDALDNLTQVYMPATATTAERNWYYCYDTTLWRLTNLKTGGCSGTSVVGLGYDAQGNLANKNGTTYDFDYGNRLRSTTYAGASVETYQYDGYGRRVLATSPAGSIRSVYSQGGQLVYQDNARSGKRINYYTLAGSLVDEAETTVSTGALAHNYQHTDALGSPVAVTNASRTVVERSEYEPFGHLLNRPLEDGPGYTGHVSDAATGLSYMQQRYYDPGIGRFLSVDPVTADDNTGDNFNRYKYGNNNPYRFTDPDGRQEAPAEAIESEREENQALLAPLLTPLSPEAMAEPTPSLIPDPVQDAIEAGQEAGRELTEEINTGSYTNYHESGKTYDGKGPESRAERSARRVERQTGDRHVRTNFTRAGSHREAFKQESRRLDSHGGARNPSNYNRIESPGKRMRQQDGEAPKPPPPPQQPKPPENH